MSEETVTESVSDRDEKGRFIQGNSGNPAGKPKGARNRLGEAFLADLEASWKEKGIEAIQQVIENRPHEYLKVVASLLPKEHNVKFEHEELTDEQLVERLARLQQIIQPFLAAGSAGSGDRVREDSGRAGPATTH